MAGSSDADPPGASASFDPRTWATTAADAAAPPEKPAAPVVNAPAAAAKPTASRRGWLIGGGSAAAGLLALGGGGWLALSRRPSASGGEGELVPLAPASGPITASVQRQIMTLDSAASIEPALAAQRLAPEAARGAAAAAISVLKDDGSEFRLELATLKPAPGAPASALAQFVSLRIKRPDGSGVSVAPHGTGFAATAVGASTHAAVQVVRGEVDAESFYTSAVTAGLSDALIPDFFQAFVYDFDFQREIEAGAVFEAAIGETVNGDGEALGGRQLLYGSMTTAKKAVALYRYKPAGAAAADPGWYDGSGRSIQRGLMRTPIEGARVSSSFGWRVHPILGFEKLHTGTDFAAPIGTPIYAAGDGVVEWASMKGPNGNLTILQHDNGWETYYLHQNAYAPGVTVGARVRQGQTIGWVGITGRSTGPHLHYELHIDKKPVDAMAQPMDAGRALAGADMADFVRRRDAIDKLRATTV